MLNLTDPIDKIPLVGESFAKKLKKLNIENIQDLFYHFPSRYVDYSKITPINSTRVGETVTVKGQIWQIFNQRTQTGKFFTLALINDQTASLQALWWNQPYLTRTLRKGDFVSLSGKIDWFNRKPTLIVPEFEKIKPGTTAIHTGRLVAIYSETEGISSKWLRRRIYDVFKLLGGKQKEEEFFCPKIEDFLPPPIKKDYGLDELDNALYKIHFPEDYDQIESAQKRLGFDELFLFQLKSQRRKNVWEKKRSVFQLKLTTIHQKLQKLVDSLPFQLTSAQVRVLGEIYQDMEKKKPMNRLLQGDVGSGKTVVAAVAMYAGYLAGFRSALMAPTEILAEQHYQTINQFLSPPNVRISLTTSSHKALSKTNPAIFGTKIQGGNSAKPTFVSKDSFFDIIVGTHALFFQKEKIPKLGLVVIDEQHRFGVKQRAKLVSMAVRGTPHILSLTATPIPRSLALTIYGDQDISYLDEMPMGRKMVKTWVVPHHKRAAAYGWISGKIKQSSDENRVQVFIICPLIEESEHETFQSVKAVTTEFANLKSNVFPDLRLGLVHGRMSAQEKEQTLNKFRQKVLDILVATPVVEVGIDIPTASIMVIEGAERFGLASLHQLRGRIGRKGQEAFCLLFTSTSEITETRRLKALEKYNDGMKLAEIDLKIRGPGEIFGVRQHGFWDFKIAKLGDIELIENTKKAAEKILPEVKNYPQLYVKIK